MKDVDKKKCVRLAKQMGWKIRYDSKQRVKVAIRKGHTALLNPYSSSIEGRAQFADVMLCEMLKELDDLNSESEVQKYILDDILGVNHE